MTTTLPKGTADAPTSSSSHSSRKAAADPLERVAEKLRANNIEAIVVDTPDEARDLVIGMVPEGAEVHSGKSKTIEDLGLFKVFMESGKYDAIRPKLYAMDRATQGREMRKLGAVPDYELGSVAAITEDGALVVASATGNQIAAYAGGAGRVILVVGSQKLVKDLDAALARIRDDVFAYENEQVRARLGVDTKLEKLLVMYGEWVEGRTTVILVREPVGV
jgi:predicted RNA-binding protein with PIN domain